MVATGASPSGVGSWEPALGPHAEAHREAVSSKKRRKGEREEWKKKGLTAELEWKQKGNADTPFKAHMLSDGTLRFICLATLLLQPIALLPDTVLIDEPELGLHPYAITVLAEIFKQVSAQRQLIVSTQSVELVNELSPDDVVVVDQENGASTFRRFTAEELGGWMEQYALGELWKRNVLGGRP